MRPWWSVVAGAWVILSAAIGAWFVAEGFDVPGGVCLFSAGVLGVQVMGYRWALGEWL